MPEKIEVVHGRPKRLRGLRRLLSSNQQLVAEELAHEAIGAGATPIAGVQPRSLAIVQGTISIITLNPRSGSAWLEAELHDGTGEVLLVWMGRRVIPGIAPGTKVRARGRITHYDGRRAIYNPAYELVL